jgi:hypothetical protein
MAYASKHAWLQTYQANQKVFREYFLIREIDLNVKAFCQIVKNIS